MYPVLFQIEQFEIYSYPVVVFFAGIFSAWILSRCLFRRKLSLDFLTDYFWIFILGTFVAARIGGIIESWSLYIADPLQMIFLLDGNYNFFAGFVGFIIIFSIIAALKKENAWKWFDASVYPFIWFFIILSAADFLAGKNYGNPTDLSWGIVYSIPEVRYATAVHPVQLYKIAALIVLLFAIMFYRRRRRYDGATASYTLFGFFLINTVLSFFVGAPETLVYNIRLSLIMSVIFLSVGLIGVIFRTHPNMHLFHHDH